MAEETESERLVREGLETEARGLARWIKAGLKPNEGFCLFLFNLGDAGALAYMASARREDVLAMLKEFIARQEGRYVETPGGGA